MHLLGNMIFMWAFSLIVEGKIGWWRFLILYLTIGTLYGALVQIGMCLLSNSDGYALGASGAIYGIMAVAVCWAPRNEISCLTWLGRPRLIDLPVSGLVDSGYFALQWILLAVQGYQMSSEMLHMVGMVVGLPIAVLMIIRNWVDCEGYDLISEISGNTGRRQQSTDEIVAKAKQADVNRGDQQRKRVVDSIHAAIDEENWKVAGTLLDNQSDLFSKAEHIPIQTLLTIVRGLHHQKSWATSIPVMMKMLELYPGPQPSIRLKLAQILIQVSKRPNKAVKILTPLSELPPKQERLKQQLLHAAHKALQSGDNEFELSD